MLIGLAAVGAIVLFASGRDRQSSGEATAASKTTFTVNGGYLRGPVIASSTYGGCKWTVIRVTSESTYVARGLAWQSCPKAGNWFVESIYDCGSGRRRVLLGGDTPDAMGNQDFNGWEYLPHGLPQTKVANVACEAAGMKFVVNPRSRV